MKRHTRDKRVLLTGASGLIGRHALAPLSRAGFEVYAVSRMARSNEGVHWLQADLTNLAEIPALISSVKPTHLLHLAWETRPGIHQEDNANFAWVSSSLELLRHFRENEGRRVVMAGTLAEYLAEDVPLREESSRLAPSTTYAKCKLHLFRLAELYCANNGVSFAWGRIFFPFGQGEHPGRLIPYIASSLRQGNPAVIKSGELHRDYIYSKDAACAMTALLDGDVDGAVNISTGRAIKLEDFCRSLAVMLGREDLLVFEGDAGDQPLFIAGDNRRLREIVGFTPRYDPEQAFEEMLADGAEE